MRVQTLAIAFVAAGSAAALAGDAATFTPLGSFEPPLEKPYSAAWGVSPDGSCVVGAGWVAGGQPEGGDGGADAEPMFLPFRWTAESGLVAIPVPKNALPAAVATRASIGGGVIVGNNGFTIGTDYYEPRNAAIWLDGATDSPEAIVLNLGYYATDVTADGSIVTGVSRPNIPFPEPDEAFRWTPDGGMEKLGVMPGGFYSWGRAISDDGETVVGYGDYTGVFTAMKWTGTGGMVPLVDDPQEIPSGALGVSADGSIIVGHIDNQLTRWTPGGVETIGTLDEAPFISLNMDTNADASVIVGAVQFYGEVHLDDFAYIWREGLGMDYLQDVLADEYGLALDGWILQTASGVSADGRTIVGWGINPTGVTEGWVVTVPPPACPGDADGDGDADSKDLNIVLGAFGCTLPEGDGGGCAGDLDGDGDTDSGDLNALLAVFGQECG